MTGIQGVVGSIRAEFVRYKALAEGALQQLADAQLGARPSAGGNSIVTICWHISGNLRSRFTDFLTTDGEKPWRQREEEFRERTVSRADLLAQWEQGWKSLLETLDALHDDRLLETVTIRGQGLRVHEALHRALAHVAYHVGQVVHAARGLRGNTWRFLSIPPGQSAAYSSDPVFDKPAAHAERLRDRADPV